jgi:hypothetical protein
LCLFSLDAADEDLLHGSGVALAFEIGWRGFTPAAKGRPMSNTNLLGVWFGYYWGR